MNVDIKEDFVRRSCPVVVFHESEQHFPCSINHLLAHSTVQQRERNDPHAAARVLGHASAEQLGTYQNTDQQEYCLSIAPSQFAGHTPVDGIVEAPVYVSLVEIENTFIDIYYVFLYAYQGSQTFRCTPPVLTHFNCVASDFGQHQGDVEHFIVRTTPTFSRILSVAYEAHGEQAWFFPGNYPTRDGHPLVYASLHGHANYFIDQPTRVPNFREAVDRPVRQAWFVTHQAHQAVETVDIIHQSPKSATWRPFDADTGIVFVSADNPETQWVRYNGYFGVPLGQPSFTQATEVWGAPLGLARRAFVKTLAAAAAKMTKVGNGQPTCGLGARHYIQQPFVRDWKHIHVYEEQDVVLSANPADIDGPLVLTPVKPGDPHQLWYQDFWNQFGCSRSTWNVIKETQHIRSEAFVLINQATKRMIWAGGQDQPLRLVDYDMGADADNTRQCTLFDMGTDENEVAGDNYRAIRPTYSPHLNWTAGHSSYELSLSDSESSPCEVFAAAWEKGDHQKWKIVNQEEGSHHRSTTQAEHSHHAHRLFSIRVRRGDAKFGLSLEDGRLCLRLWQPGTLEQIWRVQRTGFGSSVKLINADTNTALRSCGLGEEVRDTVLEDGSPAARWSLMPCDIAKCLYALRPTSDNSENLNAWGGIVCDGCEVRTFEWKGKNDKHNMMWGFYAVDNPYQPTPPV